MLKNDEKEAKLKEIIKELGKRKIIIFCSTKMKCD
jgi:ATP-dependent RNA helicase DDX5/DBP2